jgi:hypothetical protein
MADVIASVIPAALLFACLVPAIVQGVRDER